MHDKNATAGIAEILQCIAMCHHDANVLLPGKLLLYIFFVVFNGRALEVENLL